MTPEQNAGLVLEILFACKRCIEAGDMRMAWEWYAVFTLASHRVMFHIPDTTPGAGGIDSLLAEVQRLLKASTKPS